MLRLVEGLLILHLITQPKSTDHKNHLSVRSETALTVARTIKSILEKGWGHRRQRSIAFLGTGDPPKGF